MKNEVIRGLFERSRFKRGELDSLLVKKYARTNRERMKKVLALRDRPASLGALERSATQAENVISESIATLMLSLSLGLLDYEAVDSIPRVAKVLEQSRVQDLARQDVDRLMGIVDAILRQSSRK